MPSPDEAYARLFGEEASDKTRLRLLEVQKALRIHGGDALWSLFVALEYYLRMYERFPEEIREQSETLLEQHKAASKQDAETAMAEVTQSLSAHVEKVLPKLLSVSERRLKWKYIGGSVLFSVVFLVVAAAGGIYAFADWQERALNRAFAQATAVTMLHQLGEVNADTLEWMGWLYTPEGQLFQRLKRQGYPVRALLEDAVQCADKQWALQCVSPLDAILD